MTATGTREALTTARLTLRPLQPDDVTDAYVAALNDPEVVGWTEARHQAWDRAAVLRYVANAQPADGSSRVFGLFLRDAGRHIGNVRLFNLHPTHRRAELSLIVFDKTQWGRGYATEALQAVTDYAFARLGLHRVHADYYAPNVGSARAFAKAGFVIEGVFRDHFQRDGRWVDSVRIAKLAEAAHD